MNPLQKQALELEARIDYITEQTNDYQTIRAYMNNRFDQIKLTPGQTEKLRRWQYIYDQMSTGKYSDDDIRSQLEVHFSVDTQTARNDIRHAQELFSTTLSINKKFRIIMDLKLLDKMQRKAALDNQLDAYARLQKTKNELYKMLPDEEEMPGDYFQPRTNIFEFNPALLGVNPIDPSKLKALIEQLKSDLQITDIDFEMIYDNPEDSDTPQ